MSATTSENDPVAIKERGNEALRNGRYPESILHYTHAIKLDQNNSTLYSNRSYAFLKEQQYYLALADAKETIRLNPQWAKGYYRKGEVEFATYHYQEALQSYRQALVLKPDDSGIADAITRTSTDWKRDLKADDQIPWLGAGIGIILGVVIVIADFICTNKPTLTHPILMASLTIAIAMIGYGAGKAFRYYVKCQRNGLLETPLALFDDQSSNAESEIEAENKQQAEKVKYTKTQARYRYKKGKA